MASEESTLAELYPGSVFLVAENEDSWGAHTLTEIRDYVRPLEDVFAYDFENPTLVFSSQKSVERFLEGNDPVHENIRKYVRLMRTSENQPFVVTVAEVRSGLEEWLPGCTKAISGNILNDAKALFNADLVSEVMQPQPPRFLAVETSSPLRPSLAGIELMVFHTVEFLSHLDEVAKAMTNKPHSFPVTTTVGMQMHTRDNTWMLVMALQDRVDGSTNDVVLVSNVKDPNRKQWVMWTSGNKLFSSFGAGLPKLGHIEVTNVQWPALPSSFRGWTPRLPVRRDAPLDVVLAAS